jgi:hypothetical protein
VDGQQPARLEIFSVEEEEEAVAAGNIPAATDLRRFKWSVEMHEQLKEEGKRFLFLPKFARYYLLQETEWIAEPFEDEEWRRETTTQVGLGKIDCPHCFGKKTVKRNFHGALTRIPVSMPQPCLCSVFRLFCARWYNPSIVAPDYRNVHMGNIESYKLNFRTFASEGQRRLLFDTVRTYQRNCYLLTGPAGTGKTTLLTAMYAEALKKWSLAVWDASPVEAVWKVNANLLSQQYHAWGIRNDNKDPNSGHATPLPDVMPSMVLTAFAAGLIPHLFIDEFDKFKLNSSFQAARFQELLDAFQSCGGVIVASSNLSISQLKVGLGDQFGEAIVRRLTGERLNPDNPKDPADPERGGFCIDFATGKIQHNYKPFTGLTQAKSQASVVATSSPTKPQLEPTPGVDEDVEVKPQIRELLPPHAQTTMVATPFAAGPSQGGIQMPIPLPRGVKSRRVVKT